MPGASCGGFREDKWQPYVAKTEPDWRRAASGLWGGGCGATRNRFRFQTSHLVVSQVNALCLSFLICPVGLV